MQNAKKIVKMGVIQPVTRNVLQAVKAVKAVVVNVQALAQVVINVQIPVKQDIKVVVVTVMVFVMQPVPIVTALVERVVLANAMTLAPKTVVKIVGKSV